MLAGGRLQPAHRLAFRPLRRHRPARRAAGRARAGTGPDEAVRSLLAAERRTGVSDPDVLRGPAARRAQPRLRAARLARRRASRGKTVLGYGAASRAVALLCPAGRGSRPAARRGGRVACQAAACGCRGPTIPVISPAELTARHPDAVLLFVPDLMAEVRAAYPEIEAAGARWVDVEALGSRRLE